MDTHATRHVNMIQKRNKKRKANYSNIDTMS